MSVKHFTTQNFEEEVLKSDKTVLVDFWAAWCGPCQMIAPVIEEIAQEFEDIVVGKVDVDSNSELAMKYSVLSIPTIYVFKNGEVVARHIGLASREEIVALLGK